MGWSTLSDKKGETSVVVEGICFLYLFGGN